MKTYEETVQSVIERRDSYKIQKKRRNKIIASVLAICVAAGAGTGFYLSQNSNRPISINMSGTAQSDNTQSKDSGTSDSINSELDEIINQPSQYSDRLYALLRYNGNDYRLYDRIDAKFSGEYIGHTTHSYGDENGYSDINEGFLNAEELSCDVGGEIYTIKGFDPEFTVCIKSDVNGKYYAFFRLDAYIKKGSDLLGEKAYNLKNNIDSADYQSHADWDIGVMIYRHLEGIDTDDIKKLIDGICDSSVVDLRFEGWSEFFTDDIIRTQRHIILDMSADWPFRTIAIRLYKGGYVWIESLCEPGILFKVDDPVFDKIYDSAKEIKASVGELKENNITTEAVE